MHPWAIKLDRHSQKTARRCWCLHQLTIQDFSFGGFIMIDIRRSNQRGGASFEWLRSKHTFSFGNYYDEAQMGFSALRVINDDEVIPEAGFDTHGHRDMEIISYVL